jgi:hypothetical protein
MGFKTAIAAVIRKFGTDGLTACFGTAARPLSPALLAAAIRFPVPELALTVRQPDFGVRALVLIAVFAPAGDGMTRGCIRH